MSIHLIPAPFHQRNDWRCPPHFPGGSDFIAHFVDDKILLWGGRQRSSPLPTNVVYGFRLEILALRAGDYGGSWEAMNASGEVHRGSIGVSSVVCDGLLHLFGGSVPQDGSVGSARLGSVGSDLRRFYSDDVSLLFSTGQFFKLEPSGEIPPPGVWRSCWSFDGRIFLFGGEVTRADSARKHSFVKYDDTFLTNDVYAFDPNSYAFSRVHIRGKLPSPRFGASVAQMDDGRVFLHGGKDGTPSFGDFYELNMNTLVITEIKSLGFRRDIEAPSLTRMSASHLFLVGGETDSVFANSKNVTIFDVNKEEWTDEAPLPIEIGGNGFSGHRAVEWPTEGNNNNNVIVCIGGYNGTNYCSNLVVFDIDHRSMEIS